jgi:hypothetical protein
MKSLPSVSLYTVCNLYDSVAAFLMFAGVDHKSYCHNASGLRLWRRRHRHTRCRSGAGSCSS